VTPAADWPGVSVCFPAYNEEATVAGVLDEAAAALAEAGIDHEILVCDDGSTDGTGAIIDEIAARTPVMRAIHHERNQGIRETFEHLYREASKEFVFLNSTDRQWDTRVLFDLLPLTREWDIIVASRLDKHYGLARRVVSSGFNLIPRVMFGLRVRDAGAVKLVRREIIERLPLVSRSPFSEAERLVRARRAGYRITERPTETAPRRAGRARGVNRGLVLQALADVPRVWWSLVTGPTPERARPRQSSEVPNADRR
jgi:glycosyltransferase involved in cell wall biosynthesis